MGIYINKGNEGFRSAINSEYIDKTGMIDFINKTLDNERRYTCVTRCRRFGKSMAADMLYAYYDKSCDSRELFAGLAAQKVEAFDRHLNKYPVLKLDITNFTTKYGNDPENHIAFEYTGEVLLVGINYDKNGPEGKKHTCKIERITIK